MIYKITGKIQYYVIPGGFIILNHFNKDQLVCFTVQCLAHSNLNARILLWSEDYSIYISTAGHCFPIWAKIMCILQETSHASTKGQQVSHTEKDV